MAAPAKIRKLDATVVNRIAAGEIIQRPANALKELIENSLDAKSTNIQVTVKEGGLKMLQIQDNGTGILKDDMDIVCERFTTSKLHSFEDLQSLSTYGFRGEALASISHVAHLTITTKTASEKCAYRATYVDGKLKAPPAPCAGNQGTLITIENLFYNVATRRKALSNTSEEYSRITDVVTKYALHNANVGFTLKKHSSTAVQVRTPQNSTKIDNIRILYGNKVANELLEIELDDKIYKFKLHALITNANYSNKRLIFLLFINHRLVESTPLRKTIENLYTVFLPKKAHPWCYISLEINPQNIDVNVHPTKHEVRFLHEEVIIEKVQNALNEKLLANNDSRTFYIQSKLPKMDIPEDAEETLTDTKTEDNKDKVKKIYPKDMIRTDPADQKLDKFNFTSETKSKKDSDCNIPKQTESTSNKVIEVDVCTFANDKNNKSNNIVEIDNVNSSKSTEKNSDAAKNSNLIVEIPEKNFNCPKNIESSNEVDLFKNNEVTTPKEDESPISFKSYSVNQIRVETKLLSILTLRKEVEENYHGGLRKIISDLIFVGCVDEHSALIQSGVNLYICNSKKLVEELFYQIMLYDFANYGVIKFSEPLLIQDLAILGLDCEEAGWSEDLGNKEELAEKVQEMLLEKADMLRQYFSIYIDKKGYLKSLPILIEHYFPSSAGIPLYILRLSTEVNWSKEKECFHDICRETAMFYSQVDITEDSWKHTTEYILYNAIKDSLLPPKHFTKDSTILQITSLPELYKTFERC